MFTLGPPLRASSGSGDPHAANVVALLHFNDANGTTLPVSSLGAPTIANSNATNHKVTTSQAKFGSGSWNLGVGSNDGLSVQVNIPTDPSDCTIEFFFRATNDSVTYGRMFAASSAGAGNLMALSIVDGEFRVIDQYGFINATAQFIPLDTWVHYAICRSGGFTYVYVNGASAFVSASIGSGLSGGSEISLGLGSSVGMNGSDITGQFDEFRWTSAVARYPGGVGFTPPVAEFQNS